MIDLLKKALSQYGTKEIVGSKHNDTIVNYFKQIGHSWVKDDETAWCSIFISWLAFKCGRERSNKANARSWLDIGCYVKKPYIGDIVIFWRVKRNSWQGHVGVYINHSEDGRWVYCLGGNQSNKVKISKYAATRVLGYRHLNKV